MDLGGSYKTKTGEKLLTGNVMVHDAAKALFSAPFACASHDKDDVFNYGNKAALALWELPWEEFVGSLGDLASASDAATRATAPFWLAAALAAACALAAFSRRACGRDHVARLPDVAYVN